MNSANIRLDSYTWKNQEVSHSNQKKFLVRTALSVSKIGLRSSILHCSFLQLLVNQGKVSFHSVVTSIAQICRHKHSFLAFSFVLTRASIQVS